MARRNSKRGKSLKRNFKTQRNFKKIHNSINKKEENIGKKFIFWGIIYIILFNILFLLFEDTKIFQAKIGFYLISGFLLLLASRISYSAIYRKSFSPKGIVFWGVLYSITFGLINFILNKIEPIQTLNKYIFVIIFSLLFTIIIIFLRRMKLDSRGGRRRPKFLRTPSQIFSGIILIVAGILTFRFSYIIFVEWFGSAELMGWSWLIGLGFILGGILTLIAWWRNNVIAAGKHFGFAIGHKNKI